MGAIAGETLHEFQHKAGISFKDPSLLSTALTHSSYPRFSKLPGVQDNERLEFFGDAVLKLIVSEYLYHKFPQSTEGDLTKIRAQLVSDRNLAFLAEKLQVGEFLLMSHGEKNTGGTKRLSNLANAMEALLGAYYLDSGLLAVRHFFTGILNRFEAELMAQDYAVDYKTALQEYLQRTRQPLPDYVTVREEGPEHEKLFFVSVSVVVKGTRTKFEGAGRSKKDAAQLAAKAAMAELGI